MPQKDYYHILQIPPGATEPEIKKAYRKLALRYHPDKNPGDLLSESIFREINEAYDILSDPAKRKHYLLEGGSSISSFRQGSPDSFLKLTPQKILEDVTRLRQLILQMDPFRINRHALNFWLNQILSPYQLNFLKLNSDAAVNKKIIQEILMSCHLLPPEDVQSVCSSLAELAGEEAESREAIILFLKKHKRQSLWEKYQILVALVLTFLICLLIYFVAN